MKFDKFEEDGYCVLNLADDQGVHEIRRLLLETLRAYVKDQHVTLENYHRMVGDDDRRHTDIQAHVTEKLRTEKWHLPIFQRNIPLFTDLIGPDIDVEIAPYLRIIRPHKLQDCVGFHRDTIYGASPYELSVFIPFVDIETGAALHVEPGSHKKSEEEIPFKQIPSPDPEIVKGSIKHKLGFLYAPKILEENYSQEGLIPIPLRIGQVITFSLALLHGAVLNTSAGTRWSCDARIKNSFTDPHLRAERFIPLARGPVTRAAEKYIHANRPKLTQTENAL